MQRARTIAYEESPLRARLTVERIGGAVRVLVPPARDWRHLPRPAAAAIAAMGVLALLFVVAGLLNWHSDDRDALFINGALFTAVLGLILLLAHQRLYRTLVFEITADSLTLTTVAPAGGRSIRMWSRGEISAVATDADNASVILRLRGEETVELFAGARTAQAVAAALGDALAALPPVDEPPPPDAPGVKADTLPTARLQKLLWWCFGFASAVAALFLLTGHACGGAYLLLLATAPAALAVGMGQKDVYL